MWVKEMWELFLDLIMNSAADDALIRWRAQHETRVPTNDRFAPGRTRICSPNGSQFASACCCQ